MRPVSPLPFVAHLGQQLCQWDLGAYRGHPEFRDFSIQNGEGTTGSRRF